MATKTETKTETNHKRPKLEVCMISVVATRDYQSATTLCGICHNPLTFKCVNCEKNKPPESSCHPAKGNCGHGMHYHCVSEWLKTQSSCPTDNTTFKYATRDMDERYQSRKRRYRK